MAPTMKEKGFWKQQSKSTKRTWSKIVLEPNNSIYLDEIHDLDKLVIYLLILPVGKIFIEKLYIPALVAFSKKQICMN